MKQEEAIDSLLELEEAKEALKGKRVLITRAKEQSPLVAKKLRSLGAVPLEFPTLEFAPPESFEGLDNAINRLGDFDWVVFTSVNGVNYFLDRVTRLEYDVKGLLEGRKVAAVGPSTEFVLKSRGINVNFVPDKYLTKEIAVGLGDLKGKRVLLPRANIASNELRDLLVSKGALVEEVVAYRTVLPSESHNVGSLTPDFWKMNKPDYIMFTSASTVKNFIRLIGEDNVFALLGDVKIACIGPVTAQTAREFGLRVDVVAREHSTDGLLRAIINHEQGGNTS